MTIDEQTTLGQLAEILDKEDLFIESISRLDHGFVVIMGSRYRIFQSSGWSRSLASAIEEARFLIESRI